VERADSVAVATGQAISGAVGQQAEAAEGANATASRSRIDDAIRKVYPYARYAANMHVGVYIYTSNPSAGELIYAVSVARPLLPHRVHVL
jgi:hypothetical protein